MSAYQHSYICYLYYDATVCDGVFLACLWGRMPVFRAQEGNPASTYSPVSPLSQSRGLSVGTLCGTLCFSFHPVRHLGFWLVPCAVPWSSGGTSCQHIELPRVTSPRGNSPESPHDSLSKEVTRSPHTPWTASASSLWLGICCFWILDVCSPGQSQLTRLN